MLGPQNTETKEPLKIPGSVKTLVFHMKYTEQLAVGVLPEGLTHLELVDVDFDMVNLDFIGLPQSLQYIKFSMHAVGFHRAIRGLDFVNFHRPDILVEVGLTEYKDVFIEEDFCVAHR